MTYNHLPGIRAKAVFSEDGRFRYSLTLTHQGKPIGKTVCVIMQNPSTAGDGQADKSVHFLENLIFEKRIPEFVGVSRCIVVNQFAKVQTKGFRGEETDIGPENDRYIRFAIRKSDIVLVGWGKGNPYKDRQDEIFGLLENTKGKKVLFTKKHPSRGSYRDFILPREI